MSCPARKRCTRCEERLEISAFPYLCCPQRPDARRNVCEDCEPILSSVEREVAEVIERLIENHARELTKRALRSMN
jgi:hypothetical protein